MAASQHRTQPSNQPTNPKQAQLTHLMTCCMPSWWLVTCCNTCRTTSSCWCGSCCDGCVCFGSTKTSQQHKHREQKMLVMIDDLCIGQTVCAQGVRREGGSCAPHHQHTCARVHLNQTAGKQHRLCSRCTQAACRLLSACPLSAWLHAA